MIYLNPYLNFMGTCREAMKFYQSIFGGKLSIQTYLESGQSKSDQDAYLVMHAALKTDEFLLMASDGNDEHPVKVGDNVHLSLTGDDPEILTKYFNALSEDGKIDFPLAKQFWGDTFGMLTDMFGIHWMINIESEKQKHLKSETKAMKG